MRKMKKKKMKKTRMKKTPATMLII